MNVISLYNNNRHILATYVSHVQGGENKNTIIICNQFTFINSNTFVDFYKNIILLINASDMEHIKPTIFLYLALAIVEVCHVT